MKIMGYIVCLLFFICILSACSRNIPTPIGLTLPHNRNICLSTPREEFVTSENLQRHNHFVVSNEYSYYLPNGVSFAGVHFDLVSFFFVGDKFDGVEYALHNPENHEEMFNILLEYFIGLYGQPNEIRTRSVSWFVEEENGRFLVYVFYSPALIEVAIELL